MKFFWSIILGLALLSCAKLEKGDGDDLLVLNTSMRKSIKHKQESKSEQHFNKEITLEALPGEWSMVSKREGDYVLFYPCDGVNQTISINKKDGEYFLLHGLGQDAIMFKVESFEQTGEASFKLKLKALDKNLRKEVSVSWDADLQEITSWAGLVNSNGQLWFTPLEHADKFAKVVQPCKECWPEEDCPEK
ncbi:MAG TPA: hypothetical protein VIK89_01920 [Cytophagaceae bacterium]